MRIDIRITYNGLYSFHVITGKARRWVERNVDLVPWQWQDRAFVLDDGVYAANLAAGMVQAGLKVAQKK